VTIRRATADDAEFLAEMLAVAADWRPGTTPRTVSEVMAAPELARYIRGWPREGDVGVVAEVDRPTGAAWWRFLPSDDPGYGFVDAATPEISIGVVEQARGQGQGRLLLEALIEEGLELGLHGLSLSVESDNPAKRLYQRHGFQAVGGVGGSVTMVLALSS
jgi:ribosomal protein S18 acetylase RimI-like enzyme